MFVSEYIVVLFEYIMFLQFFFKALEECKQEEERIESMMVPLEGLQEQAQTEFNKVSNKKTIHVQ